MPYGYTAEVVNTFKRLDLTECFRNYGRRFVTLYGGSDQNHPNEKEMQEGKVIV